MRSSAVNIGDSALASQYNNLRSDALGGSFLLPHEQAVPDLTLKVEAGVYYTGATRVIFAGGNSPSFAAPAANPRIDLLVADSAGVLSRVIGTEAASPAAPAYPTDKVVICEVFNRVGQTTIRDADTAGQGYIKQDVRPVLGGAFISSASQIADSVITDAKLASADFVKQSGAVIYAADAGTTDDYAVTLSPVPAAYITGMVVRFKANTANTGIATLNVNALGAKTIKKNGNADLADNDIKAAQLVEVIYDGVNFQLISPVSNQAPNRKQEVHNFLFSTSPGVTTTSTTFVDPNQGGQGNGNAFLFDPANWDSGITWYFEVLLGNDAGQDLVEAQLAGTTGSTVSGRGRQRSAALTMPGTATTLSVNFRLTGGAGPARIWQARLIGVMPI